MSNLALLEPPHTYRDWATTYDGTAEFDDLHELFSEIEKGCCWQVYPDRPVEGSPDALEVCPHFWHIIEDRSASFRRATKKLSRDPSHWQDFALQWRESHRSLRGRAMIVYLTPGQSVRCILWHPTQLTERQAREQAWTMSGDSPEPRFASLSHLDFEQVEVSKNNWRAPIVYLEAETAAIKSLRECSTSVAAPLLGHATGLAPLDVQFRGVARLPVGSRVGVCGDTAQCKTLLMLEMGESLREQGCFVVWIALDEPKRAILIRRLQRRGISPSIAQTLPAAPLAKLENEDFFVVDENDGYFEDLVAQAAAEADGKPVVIAIDSVQKIVTRDGVGRGERERINAAIDAMQAAQRKWPSLTILFTSEVARVTGEAKGSASIDFGATLLLAVELKSERLAVSIRKNRDGERRSFALVADTNGQRLCAVDAVEQVKADAALWARLQAALTELGTASQNELERHLGGKATTLRACIKRHVEAEDLVRVGDRLRLA